METIPSPSPPFEPDTQKIKRKLLQKGVYPSPKILHTLRKKETQKHNRKLNRLQSHQSPPLTDAQKQALAHESNFQTIKREYKHFTRSQDKSEALMVGKPWESLETVKFREAAKAGVVEYNGEKLNREELKELRDIFQDRKREELQWVLDDDVELQDDWLRTGENNWDPARRRGGEREQIRFLVDRLSAKEITPRDWKFTRVMKLSGLQFTERQLLEIVQGLGDKGCWKQAMSVVEWVYTDKEHRRFKSRFVYTKLLAVLGKARRPQEALRIFNRMRGDCHIYPDMAAYRSIAVTLGQAGFLKELVKIIECMRQKPSKITKNMRRKNWDPCLEPDVVVYNAVLNACVPSHQWKGVSWVFEQLRKSGLKPNGATYGLAMEVMLQSGKYDHVHEFFRKMRRNGEASKALTYKVLVRAFWEEGKVNEAIEAVRDMEQRGVVGSASVYYELACCLCKNGRWEDAMVEVEKMIKLPRSKPLEVAFTGMIISSMDGGHVDDCISIFEHMKAYCNPNIGTINVMLKVYGRNDMFSKAKELFEDIKSAKYGCKTSLDDGLMPLVPDEYTYGSMLEASGSALQWEYFEYVYKEMTLTGYQLDQSKHASLLVEASRAGKWYLLEHAFETILEAGDIPHSLFFTELIFQATAEHNHDRAVTLINTVAHAPFQVSEGQWTDLFGKNGDRISRDSLNKLLDALSDCDVAMEATVVNLSRSLHSICRSGTPSDTSSSIGFGSQVTDGPPSDGKDEGSDGNERSNEPNFSANMTGEDPLASNSDPLKTVSRSLNFVCNKDGTANLGTYMEEDFADDMESTDCLADDISSFILNENSNEVDENLSRNSEDVDGLESDAPISKVDDPSGSNLPSAYEILAVWKESRKKDGIFLPFQNVLKSSD